MRVDPVSPALAVPRPLPARGGPPGPPATGVPDASLRAGPRPPGKRAGAGAGQLTDSERQVVAKLKARDREVRAHEMAHLAAAAGYANGGMRLQYQTGPDGGRYAVGGEVDIDTAPVRGHPEATMEKAQVVKRAALAPARPSAQDQRVAAQASRMEAQARQEVVRQRAAGTQGAEATPTVQTEPADEGASGASSDPAAAKATPRGPSATGPAQAGQLLDLVA